MKDNYISEFIVIVGYNKDKVIDLNLWEGDKHFLPKLLETNDFFTMKLVYDKEDQLLEVK